MTSFILNISNSVSPGLKGQYVSWIKTQIQSISADFLQSFQLAEMIQLSPDGDDMIIVQIYFNAGVDVADVHEILNDIVSNTHQHFAQKVLSFGSVMKLVP